MSLAARTRKDSRSWLFAVAVVVVVVVIVVVAAFVLPIFFSRSGNPSGVGGDAGSGKIVGITRCKYSSADFLVEGRDE